MANPARVICFTQHVVSGGEIQQVSPVGLLAPNHHLSEAAASYAVEMQGDFGKPAAIFDQKKERDGRRRDLGSIEAPGSYRDQNRVG